jgi:CheY-like chemotaxis protein
MHILIAEDLPVTQMLHSKLMDRWGFVFDMASNGAEAVDYAIRNEGKYDLGLLDIEMPVMNGLEATRQIRQKVKYFPLMAYSSNAAYREPCLESGFDAFVEKPALPDTLLSKIKELTVKSIGLHYEQQNISIKQVTPMNAEELEELRKLEKQGLAKFSLIGTEYKFVVHKNIQNKLSHDFVAKQKLLSEFIDRSPESPGIIHVYASNLHANKRYISTELLNQLVIEENKEMEKYTKKEEYEESKI